MAAGADRRIGELEMLSEGERRQVLVEWNQTERGYEKESCVQQLFEEQAARTPEAAAVVSEEQALTYGELNERANQLAHYLREAGVGAEVRVGLCVERSAEMVVGLLGILKAGGAYVPLDPQYPAERLSFMLQDAQVQVLVTVSGTKEEKLEGEWAETAAGVHVIELDQEWGEIRQEPRSNLERVSEVGNPAYVIYTSGSTGMPKGAMNIHRGLCNRLIWMQERYGLSPEDRVLQKTPFTFDVSVWEFFWPLLTGACLVVARPGGHQDVGYLVRAVQEFQITTIHFVPPMLTVWLEHEGVGQCDSLKRVICSGEALSIEQATQFHRRLKAELHNLYGPTEASIDVSRWECENDDARDVVPIGRPIANTEMYVLDGGMEAAPVGVSGELYIGGAGLARGYLNRPSLTAERFVPHPFSREGGERLYRTGDIGKWRRDGELEYAGRVDEQVKIRGYRIEPGEIEAALREIAGVREAVVVAREQGSGQKRLGAYLGGDEAEVPGTGELREQLQERLPEYMVPTAYVWMERLPLTANGKLNRKALPEPEAVQAGQEQSYVGPRTPTEELLCGIWAKVLGVERVGVEDNFFELGGHSLLATQVVSQLRQVFGIELPLRQVFEAPTVAGLAVRVEEAQQAGEGRRILPLEAVERGEELALSYAQQRLWFIDQLEGGSAAYNIAVAVRMKGKLEVEVLRRSLNEVVRRHEALRTRFEMRSGVGMQVIAAEWEQPLEVVDLQVWEEEEREAEVLRLAGEEACRRFDLVQGPLLRARLLLLGAEEQVLLFTMHHIISDGWSMGVLVREVAELYEVYARGEESRLSELKIQYSDYAVWQREYLESGVGNEQLGYWKEQLEGMRALELPLDGARPGVQSYRGASRRVVLSAERSEQLRQLSRSEGVTLFMTLLAGFQVLLSRWSGEEDVAVGTPVANRTRAEVEPLIGFFVNTLVLRTDLSGQPTVRELLRRVREVCLGAYAHQDVPFERVVEELNPERDLSRHPLFQSMFALQNAPVSSATLAGLRFDPVPVEMARSRFDLFLSVSENSEADGRLAAMLEYATDLFAPERMERFLEHWQRLLEAMAAGADRRIGELEMLSEGERRQVLVEWTQTERGYEKESCVQQLFEEQAARTPEAVAVVSEEQALTYGELNERANQLAHYLREAGVGAEVRVGLCVERSAEMVVGLLGILKAGGAYVPLDPQYPAERLSFMLQDAGIEVLLTQSMLMGRLPQTRTRLIQLDRDWPLIAQYRRGNPPAAVDGENAAYVIYTSGSTGTPKGVAVVHDAVINMLGSMVDFLKFGSRDALFSVTSLSFDIAALELFVPLIQGAVVFITRPEVVRDARA